MSEMRKAAERTTGVVCSWPGCGEPATGTDLCTVHTEWWDHTAKEEAWGMALETVEHLAGAVHAGLGLPQLDEAMQAAIERARKKASYHEAERARLEEIVAGRE